MRSLAWSVSAILVVIACVLPFSRPAARAQSANCWGTPFVVFETGGGIAGTALVADGAGQLHAFWASNPGVDGSSPLFRGEDLDIYYARWDGKVWSSPVDIVAGANGYPQAIVDDHQTVHLFWRDVDGSLSHSWSHIADAVSAPSWEEVIAGLAGPGIDQGLAIDEKGDLHLVYPVDHLDIAYQRSTDRGRTWSRSTSVSAGAPSEAYVHQPRIALDSVGGLHVVWAVTSSTKPNTLGVMYSRSVDDAATWTAPIWIADPWNTEPNIATVGERVVHIVWNGQVTLAKRFHRWSTDGGVTWSDTAEIVSAPGGILGPPGIAVDSAGTVHVVASSDAGVRYAYWDGRSWADSIAIYRQDKQARDPATAITEGNLVHTVFVDGGQRIVHISCLAKAPEIPGGPLATRVATELSPLVLAERPLSRAPTLSRAPAGSSEALSITPPQVSSPGLPVAVGLVSALGIVLLVLLTKSARRMR